MRRPRRLVVVTGTGTDIGKTWWGAETIRLLREQGVAVAARKPVQSGTDQRPTDADVLADATGEEVAAVCPRHRWHTPAMAPPMAAAGAGAPSFTIAALAREIVWADATEIGWVEGAGGPRSPLAADGDTVDLIAALSPDLVVLVADAGLGTINAVRLCCQALEPWPLVVALNHFDPNDPLHRANREWLERCETLHVVVEPARLAHDLV